MSKFNQYGDSETANILNGSEDIYGYTLRANNLEGNQPVKSNQIGQLVSSKLDINDINNLQTILDDTITTPYDGTIQATDFATALVPSFNTSIGSLETKSQNILSSSLSPIQTVFDGQLQSSDIKTNTISSANEETNLVNLVCPIDMGGYNIFNANSIQTTFFSGVQIINSKPDTDINVNLLGIEPTNLIVPRIKTNSISTITGDLSINTNIDMNNYDIKNVNNITTLQYTATNGTLRNINSFENQDINLQNTGETPGYVQASRIKTDSISSYQPNIQIGSNLIGSPNNTISITGLSSVSALQLTSGNDIATLTIPSLNTFASNISARATALETKTQYQTSTTGTTSFGSNINMNYFNLNQVDQIQSNNIVDLSGITSKSNEDILVNLVGTSTFSVGKIKTNQLINGLGGALTNILLNSSLDFQNSMRINNVAKIGTNSINTDIIASLTPGNPISLTSDVSATNKNITDALSVSATDLSSTNLTTTNLKQGTGGALTSVLMGSNLNLGATYKIDNANKISTSSINADIINSFTPGSPVQVVSDVVFSTNKNITGTTNISTINVSSTNLITDTLKKDVGGVLTNILMGSSLDFQNTMRINNANKISTNTLNTDILSAFTPLEDITLGSNIDFSNTYNLINLPNINGIKPSGGVYSESNNNTFSGSVANIEQNILGVSLTKWGTLTVPGGAFVAGDTYSFKVGGSLTCANNNTFTIRLRSNFGQPISPIFATVNVASQGAQSDNWWELELEFMIVAIGGINVATIRTNGNYTYHVNGGSFGYGFATLVSNNEFSTTIENTLCVTFQSALTTVLFSPSFVSLTKLF